MYKFKNMYNKYITQITFVTAFSAIFIRYVYYGFKYYYQLDDYIQYHNFATSLDYCKLIIKEGFLAARPLAGITDLYVWSKFYSVMILCVLLISVMYAVSAMLFLSLFRRLFGTGIFFITVYTLLPLGFEGTYWMSASSRIVTGLFFSSLAILIFQKICDSHKLRYIPIWMLIQLISFCYYEQVLVFSFTLTIIILFIKLRSEFINKEKRRSLWGLLSFINIIIYFSFTNIFAVKGMFTARMELIFPTTLYYFKVFFPDITRQIGAAFIKGGLLTFVKGFYRGVQLILNDFNWIYLLAVSVIVFSYFILSKKTYIDNKSKISVSEYITPITTGILLAIAPVTPFFILGNPWFSLRSTVCSLVGIALITDTLLRLIFKNKKIAVQTVTASFVLVCCISSVSEIHDYKATYEYDRLMMNVLTDQIEGKTDLGRIGILNLNASYLDDQNYFYHEHIHGITENSWALFGALASISNELYSDITPLATDGFSYYTGWNREVKKIDNFDTLYFWDSKREVLSALTTDKIDDTSFILYFEDGTKCAFVWEEGDYGYIEIYQY